MPGMRAWQPHWTGCLGFEWIGLHSPGGCVQGLSTGLVGRFVCSQSRGISLICMRSTGDAIRRTTRDLTSYLGRLALAYLGSVLWKRDPSLPGRPGQSVLSEGRIGSDG